MGMVGVELEYRWEWLVLSSSTVGMVGVEREYRWEWLVLSSSTDGNGWC